MIPVCIFTFDKDAPAALLTARRAMALGFTRVYLEVDAAHPFPPELRKAAVAEGFHYRLTSFVRHKNLLGVECFRGLLESYRFVLRDSGAAHLLKLDSDTLINRTDRLFQAVRDDVVAAAHADTGRNYHFYGCCCLLSARLVEYMAGVVAAFGAVPGHRNGDMPEDKVTGELADASGMGEVRRWDLTLEGGFAAGWKYHKATVPMAEYHRRFDVVIFGNRCLLTGKDCEKRDKVFQTMLEFTSAHPVALPARE